jgi:hypothetical protein
MSRRTVAKYRDQMRIPALESVVPSSSLNLSDRRFGFLNDSQINFRLSPRNPRNGE